MHHGRSLVAVANSSVCGLSGAFIPVSEDQGMIDAFARGALTLAKLEAMTTVCSVGLDMIAVPADTSAATVTGLIADEMAIGMVNSKTTAVRVLPIPDRGPGEMHDWGGRLGAATILDPGPLSCEVLWLGGVTDPGADAE